MFVKQPLFQKLSAQNFRTCFLKYYFRVMWRLDFRLKEITKAFSEYELSVNINEIITGYERNRFNLIRQFELASWQNEKGQATPHQSLLVACFALAMQQLLNNCRKLKTPNITAIFLSANFAGTPCSQLAIFSVR